MMFFYSKRNYLRTDTKDDESMKDANIKKYKLVWVLFARWMAAGCSPRIEKGREKIELNLWIFA